MLFPIRQLQELHGKLNIPDRTLPQFDIAPAAPLLVDIFFGALLHSEDIRAHGFSGTIQQEGPHAPKKALADLRIARHHAPFEQGLFLP